MAQRGYINTIGLARCLLLIILTDVCGSKVFASDLAHWIRISQGACRIHNNLLCDNKSYYVFNNLFVKQSVQ